MFSVSLPAVLEFSKDEVGEGRRGAGLKCKNFVKWGPINWGGGMNKSGPEEVGDVIIRS